VNGIRPYIGAVTVTALAAALALLVVSAVVVARTYIKRRCERQVLARLPVGPDGIIPGAGPIDLPAPPGAGAPVALLLHGFGDTPQTLAALASALHARGWAVRVPLLPGHGRTLPEWAATRGSDWLAAARSELDAARRSADSVALVGLSMGGTLATLLAAEAGRETAPAGTTPRAPLAALALIAPYYVMPASIRLLANAHVVVGACLPYARGQSAPSILDPVERARNLAYGVATPRLVYELARLAGAARAALPDITTPTLLVQSRSDNRIPPAVADSAFARLTVTDKRLEWIDHGGHIITVDHGRELVAACVGDWLDARAPARARSWVARRA
jgi:carboxylesterase